MAWIPRWRRTGISSTNAFFSMVSSAGAPRRPYHVCAVQRAAEAQGRPTELRYTETHLDTIFALSTHPGKAGIAVVRVSGPQAKSVCASSVRGVRKNIFKRDFPCGFPLIAIDTMAWL
jgi:tRNA modification GTPase